MPDPVDGYYQIDIPRDLRNALEDLIEGRHVPRGGKDRLRLALNHARLMPLPLVSLEWADVEEEAQREGVGVTDILWDRMGRAAL